MGTRPILLAAEGVAKGTVLGLDEAGRGSLIGPLVVGGFLTTERRAGELAELGVRDSKLLSPARRSEIYSRLPAVGTRCSVVLPPRRIDRYVRRGKLNVLEAEAFATLVRRHRPTRTIADACDVNARRFASRVSAHSGTDLRVEARHRADRTELVVGAASIVAKVERDLAIAQLAERLGSAIGSGYPSDDRTTAFVRSVLERGPAPDYVRTSWATMGRIMARPEAPALEAFGR
ncbi:MAG TPA: ribonuclease HII [Thermoplasmata archaeon]|nr:ribonuclease HII [Thermoplasmata archaeon]